MRECVCRSGRLAASLSQEAGLSLGVWAVGKRDECRLSPGLQLDRRHFGSPADASAASEPVNQSLNAGRGGSDNSSTSTRKSNHFFLADGLPFWNSPSTWNSEGRSSGVGNSSVVCWEKAIMGRTRLMVNVCVPGSKRCSERKDAGGWRHGAPSDERRALGNGSLFLGRRVPYIPRETPDRHGTGLCTNSL